MSAACFPTQQLRGACNLCVCVCTQASWSEDLDTMAKLVQQDTMAAEHAARVAATISEVIEVK